MTFDIDILEKISQVLVPRWRGDEETIQTWAEDYYKLFKKEIQNRISPEEFEKYENNIHDVLVFFTLERVLKKAIFESREYSNFFMGVLPLNLRDIVAEIGATGIDCSELNSMNGYRDDESR